MVIGNGLIAKAFNHFKSDKQVVIFASGVSNSKEKDASQFEKEMDLIRDNCIQFPNAHFVYFSTTSIEDPSVWNNGYVKHKLIVESYIASNCPSYHIFRLSNVVGNTDNPNTIFNFFSRKIIYGEPFILWKGAFRNLIDINDVNRICTTLINNRSHCNQIINVAYPESIAVTEIITVLEKSLSNKAKYELVNLGDFYTIDTKIVADYFTGSEISAINYLENLIKKYLKPV